MIVSCNIDETAQDPTVPASPNAIQKIIDGSQSLAREVINARENIPLVFYQLAMKNELGNFLMLLAYSCERPSRRKRRMIMDIDKMVEEWVPLVKKLACAHDVDEKDAASAALDEHIAPILAAPVSQIRSFYRTLTKRLKEDPAVPWAVWKMFEFWGTNVLDKIEKEEIAGLKKEIASRIADNSIRDVPQEDWREAMIGALMWRSPEKLAEIEKGLEAGHKPRVRGRESCLFLVVDKAEVML